MGQFFNPALLSSTNPAVAYNPFLDFGVARNSQSTIDAITLNNLGDYNQYLVSSPHLPCTCGS